MKKMFVCTVVSGAILVSSCVDYDTSRLSSGTHSNNLSTSPSFVSDTKTFGTQTPKTDAAEPPKFTKRLRWNDPDSEKKWKTIIQSSERVSTGPRSGTVDTTESEGLLEAFGMRYMPNAYGQYQEERQKALEIEQVIKENFPRGKGTGASAGKIYEKANKRLAETVAEMFRRHDEICFFLLMHQAGIFSDAVLAKYDTRPISIRLETMATEWPDDTPSMSTFLSAEDSTFVSKYMPETYAAHQRLSSLFSEGCNQYRELRNAALSLDAVRLRWDFSMFWFRLTRIKKVLTGLQESFSDFRVLHSIGDTSASELAELDRNIALQLQSQEKGFALKSFIAMMATVGVVHLPGGTKMEMVWCPAGEYRGIICDEEKTLVSNGFWMAKYEVTFAQWKAVMDNVPRLSDNDKNERGEDYPVYEVSADDASTFCQKAMAGLRLPSADEWYYACRAGRNSDCVQGDEVLGEMTWYYENSGLHTHPVGQKQPNAWGLYDMFGNIAEIFETSERYKPYATLGGCFQSRYPGDFWWRDSVWPHGSGFRPVFSGNAQ